MLIEILIVLLAAALVLAWIGFRGRRVDDHPVCRRCRFDLTGLPAESNRCPECGGELTGLRAIVIGNRVRRSRMVGIGLTISAVIIAGFTIVLSGAASSPRVLAIKPLWWLRGDVRFSSPEMQNNALTEVSRRIDKKQITADDLLPLINDLLARQANSKIPWSASCGDFIERAHAAGAIDSVRWHRYLDQMMTLSAEVRPIISRGDPIPVHLTLVCRAGTQQRWGVFLSAHILNETEHPSKEVNNIGTRFNDGTCNFHTVAEVDDRVIAATPDGKTVLPVYAEARLYDGWYGQGPVVARAEFRGRVPLTLNPTDRPVVHPLADDSVRQAVARQINIRLSPVAGHKDMMDVMFQVNAEAPVPLAYDMEIHVPGAPPLKFDVIFQGGHRTQWDTWREVPHLDSVKSVDVVLRPSRKVAAEDFEMTRYWDQPIVFHDVPIIRDKNTGWRLDSYTYSAEFPEK